QVGRLDRLVDSILASVRGDGLQALARVPFDLPAAVDETVAEMAPLLRSHPLRWSGGHGHAAARGDPARFRQVLEHLLDNEAKYVPAGGGVSLGTWRDGDEVRVYITDDGPGVPREEWDSVFDAYVRLGGRGQGSGIGLYAAHRLMEAMGGRAWLEPNGYGGSRFVLALPAAD
ncbi:MAG: sensor histidine kinase, partial [Candidatus Limnocylindrales bacterium]